MVTTLPRPKVAFSLTKVPAESTRVLQVYESLGHPLSDFLEFLRIFTLIYVLHSYFIHHVWQAAELLRKFFKRRRIKP